MAKAVLVGVIVTPIVVAVDDDGNGSSVQVEPIQVASKDWPAWATTEWTGLWASATAQIEAPPIPEATP